MELISHSPGIVITVSDYKCHRKEEYIYHEQKGAPYFIVMVFTEQIDLSYSCNNICNVLQYCNHGHVHVLETEKYQELMMRIRTFLFPSFSKTKANPQTKYDTLIGI